MRRCRGSQDGGGDPASQPGSTAEFPLLVAACEAGRKLESRVLDLPITPDWPSNGQLGYKGETTLKEAFVSSRNAAAVRLTQELGIRRVAEVSRRLEVDPGSNPDPAFVLGSYSANVLNVTAAYATVANGGYRVSPSGVLAVVDGRGQVRASYIEASRTRVILERCIQPTRAEQRCSEATGQTTSATPDSEGYGETRGRSPPSTPRRFAQPYYPLIPDHELWPGGAEELLERW